MYGSVLGVPKVNLLFFMTIPGSLFLWNRHYLALHAFPTSFSKGKICPFTPNRCSHPPLQKTRQRGHFRSRTTNEKRRRRRRKGSVRRPRRRCGICGTFHVPNAPKCFSCSAAQKAMLGMCETPVDVVGTTLTRLVGARIRKDAQERIGAIQVSPITFQAFDPQPSPQPSP